MRVALGLEYDGSSFCGWQTQPNGCAVQDVLEKALSAIASHPVHTICAGRTDSGVHALEQIVHFDTDTERPLSAWVRGVNALLPAKVAVNWAHLVANDFHARFSALQRQYRYVLLNRPTRPGVYADRVGWFHMPLRLELMQQAAQHLLGEHDFSSFRAAECQAQSPVKYISELHIQSHGDFFVFDCVANSFLQHMVRNIVACLVYVGAGKQEPEWIQYLLEQRDRRLAAPTFSAAGLYLLRVEYDPVWKLPTKHQAEDLMNTFVV